jgi:hypothetical protein
MSFSVTFDIRNVSAQDARRFTSDFFARSEVLGQYFEATKFTDLFAGDFLVTVYDYAPPASEALLPAWEGHRGQMKFAAKRITEKKAAILHELAHVHAPNQARFLAEGYSTYLEELLGDIDVHPMHGQFIEARMKLLHGQYTGALAAVDLIKFDAVSTQRDYRLEEHVDLQTAIPDGNDRGGYAYLVSASFVKYLINAYGLTTFKKLYWLTPLTPTVPTPTDVERYKKVFGGKSLSNLEVEWRNWLAS